MCNYQFLSLFMFSYLGPYSGRSPDLIQKLRGVMTNPNCEYGANFVAIYTLAAWSKCTVDGCSSLSANDAVSSDIKLELGAHEHGDSNEDVVPPPPDKLPSHVYHPRNALKSAISEWMKEFTRSKPVWGPITKPQVGLNPTGVLQPSINTCMTSTSTTSSINSPLPSASIGGSISIPSSPKQPVSSEESTPPASVVDMSAGLVLNPSLLCPGATPVVPVMNSLVSTHEVVMERSCAEIISPTQDAKVAN